MNICKLGIIGAGQMGSGIAHMAAMAGCDVLLYGRSIEKVNRAVAQMDKAMARSVEKGKMTDEDRQETLGRIKTTDSLDAMSEAEFIIEALLEDMDLKIETFNKLNKVCRSEVIFTTNTSSLSITKIAVSSGRPDRFCGMHFFNPATVMQLVEVISGAQSSDETITTTIQFARSLGKTAVEVKKDSPGFIVNRLLMPHMVEAARLLQEGVASVEDIDTAVKLGLNYPMGPFEMYDMGGIDLASSIMQYFAEEFNDNQYAPPLVVKQMLRAGKIGRKGGEGFYKYRT